MKKIFYLIIISVAVLVSCKIVKSDSIKTTPQHTECIDSVKYLNYAIIEGYVMDYDNNEFLDYANVLVMNNQGIIITETVTNKGKFSIIVQEGEYTFTFTYIGMIQYKIKMKINQGYIIALNVRLRHQTSH